MPPCVKINDVEIISGERAKIVTPDGVYISNRSVPSPARYREWYLSQGYVTLTVLTTHYQKETTNEL